MNTITFQILKPYHFSIRFSLNAQLDANNEDYAFQVTSGSAGHQFIKLN
jgi:hypothetical protein